jgi:integrase
MARGNVWPRQRNDGTTAYMVRVEMPPDPRTGNRQRRVGTFDTRKEADKTLTAWLADLDKGIAVEPTKLRMADLLGRWLGDEAAARVRPRTLEDYRATVENHVTPALGNVPDSKLTVADVQRFRSQMIAKGSPRTAQLAMLRLKQALSWAVSADLLPRNVAAGVKPPPDKAEERRTWTKEEARTFLAEAESDTYSPLWRLLLSTGLRPGEALGPRWRDIDLDQATLSVRQAVVVLPAKDGEKARPVIQEPKSKAANRTIDLDPATVAALRVHKDRQTFKRKGAAFWEDHDLVFCTGNGRILNPNNVLRNFEANVERSGVPKIGVHDLRHTHATWLLFDGIPVTLVSKRLGHAKVSITLDTYSHILPEYERRAVESIGAALFG